MGVLLSRFRRKQTTIEILEGIDKEINRLQRNRKVNQDRQKHIVTSLLIYSIAFYVLAAVVFFCLYFPDTWQLRFLYSLPLLVFPFLIWGLKKLLHWYFVKRIASNDLALQQLREKKKQILEDVAETETYKRAREILEKFDPGRLRKLEVGSSEVGVVTSAPITSTSGTVVQQRNFRTPQPVRPATSVTPRMSSSSTPLSTPVPARPRQPVTPFPSTPTFRQPQVRPVSQPQPRATAPSKPQATALSQPQATGLPHPRTPFPSQVVTRGGYSVMPPGLPMPRTVLPRERGTMDKLMDYLVGDGPENRYALICQYCSSHNGMALKEEFEYLSFRCCYCYNLNPAKKQRPLAPRLEFFAPGSNRKGQSSGMAAGNDESEDEEDDDDEEGDGDSDQGSAECDTSAGISPIQSGKSPVISSASSSIPSWSSGHRAGAGTQSKEDVDSKLAESKSFVVTQVNKSPAPHQTAGQIAAAVKGPVASQDKGSLSAEVKGPVAGQDKGSLSEVKGPVTGQEKGQVPGEAKVPIKSSVPSKATEPRLPSSATPKSEETKIPVARARTQQKEAYTAGGQTVSAPGTQAAMATGKDVGNMRSDTVGKLKDISDNGVLTVGPQSSETAQGKHLSVGSDKENPSSAINVAGSKQEVPSPKANSSLVPQDDSADGDHVTEKDQSRSVNSPVQDNQA
ncbi:hypothetical protein BsWGS_09566 [Bradybaena similaris]